MRSPRRSDRGLSEIVGTLMLILIVVAAATLLAAFVASYQKQVQSEQSFTHDQSLESIHILSLETTLAPSGSAYATFVFYFASEYVNPSGVLGISIDHEPLKEFNWTDISTATSGQFSDGEELVVAPFDEVMVTLDLDPASVNFSFLAPSSVPLPNEYLEFDVYTHLQNDFNRIFLPPVPLQTVSLENPTGQSPYTVLDGSNSFQPEGNGSIVNWAWSISGGATLSGSTTLGHATFSDNGTAETQGALSPGFLTATDVNATFTVASGFVWQPWDQLVFTPSNNLTASNGGGACAVPFDSSVTGVTSSSLNGTRLNVTFRFNTIIAAG